MNAAILESPLTTHKAMRLNVCTTANIGYSITTAKRDFFTPKIRANCHQFLRIGAKLTLRNKASNRTNKGGGIFAVVDALHRLTILSGALSLNNYGVMQP